MLDSVEPIQEESTTPKRRRSATRQAGPPAPLAPAVEAPEAQPTAKPTRTRRKAAAPPAETVAAQAAVEAAPAETAIAEAAATQAVVEKAKPVRRRRSTAAVAQTPDEATAEIAAAVAAEPEPEPEPAPAQRPKRTRRPAKDSIAEAVAELEAQVTPTRRRTRKAAVSVDALPTLEQQTSEAEPAVAPAPKRTTRKAKVEAFGLVAESPDQVLESLAAAIGAPEEPVDPDAEPTDEAEPVEVAEDEDSDEHRRRRRRRGGRRRRRGAEADSDADLEAEADPAAAEAGSEEVAADSGSRRRRRRRRRGEEIVGADDDPSEVSIRVRDPRPAHASAAGEVTGIEGSTRMEAKKQRRREGRAAGRRRAPILSESEFLARRESVDRKMLIRQAESYSQIAVLEDGVLVEHYVDRASAASMIGNIYLGRVQNVLPSMEAAFIDIGRGRNAVLYAGEVDWDSFGVAGEEKKVEKVFKSGQAVLVQVSKDPVGAKGARLTSHISIPGRYVVYSPGGQLSGISRKLPEPERRRLKDILDALIEPEASVIIRTAAEGVVEEELVRDVNRLKAQWEVISGKAAQLSAPKLLYTEPELTVRIVRDLFTEDFRSLVVDGNGDANDAWDTMEAYVAHVAPQLADRLQRWDHAESGDLFDHYRVQEQVAKALERKVFLPSGGSLIIDRTEAMTVVDVNTGKFTGSQGNLEATVTANNLEAAEEIVRQLRLRDIGGIIVVDFIDMVLPSNRELLLRRLVECLSRDRTRHQVAEVTSLGLVQLTRKKIGTGLAEAFTVPCETCHGRGYHTHDVPVASQAPADGGDREQRRRSHSKPKLKTEKKDKPKRDKRSGADAEAVSG
ncbi:MAG: Rne/Rng family ribonuclease [Propionibacteriaceae bacterium]|nr:Rne/Rng family ribonuclease [Propionibacteriaceae bacterium]